MQLPVGEEAHADAAHERVVDAGDVLYYKLQVHEVVGAPAAWGARCVQLLGDLGGAGA